MGGITVGGGAAPAPGSPAASEGSDDDAAGADSSADGDRGMIQASAGSPSTAARSSSRSAGSRSAPTSTPSPPATGVAGPSSTRCASTASVRGDGTRDRLPLDLQGPRAARRRPGAVDSDETRDDRASTCRSSRSSTAGGTGSTSRPATSELVLEEADWGFETDRLAAGPDHDRHHHLQPARLLRRPAGPALAATRRCSRSSTRSSWSTRAPRRSRDNDKFDRRGRGPRRQAAGSSSSPTSVARAASPGRCARPSPRVRPTTSCCSTTTSSASSRASCARSPSPTWRRRPTLVGGHMFSLYDRSVMHAYGEAMAKYKLVLGSGPGAPHHGHDFARSSLRSTRWLHRRIDVDYNGWWMCLIPTQVIREIGLSLPMFIKWDDAEFGLRAGGRLPDGVAARGRGLARAVDREGRHARLAGLLPRAQPPGLRPAALALHARRPAGAARASRTTSSG